MKFAHFQKLSFVIGLFGITLLFTACPYSSSVPVDEGSLKIPDNLVGQWIKSSDVGSDDPSYFVISKDDKTHATARKMEYSSSDARYDTTTYHLTFSDVGGDIFMNAIEEGGSSYSLYKFVMDEKSKEITTYEVTDYIKETFNSSKELKDFIAKNKSMSFFYTNSTDTYTRK